MLASSSYCAGLLEVERLMPVLGCLLDHVVQLLLSHADHGKLTHLWVTNDC